MPARLSRRKLAAYAAEKMLAGTSKKQILKELAAYLMETGRVREAALLVRDIEHELADRGVVVASVVTAHPLTSSVKSDIDKLAGAKSVQLRETVDPAVLGGIQINLPGKRFDGTIRHKLNALRASKI